MNVSKENKSYIKILKSSKTLFWKHGISRITVDEICRESEVSKVTFYRLFKNKIDVAEKVLIEINDKAMSEYRDVMKQDIPYKEKLRQLILNKQACSKDISEEFLKDIYRNEKLGLLEILKRNTKFARKELLNDFNEAKKDGSIRQGLKPEFIMYMIDYLNSLAYDQKLISMYETPQALIMEITNFFFYGILPESNI
jgi:AcrR family transcriptional regulator